MQNSPLELEEYLLKELQFALTDDLATMGNRTVKYDGLSIDIEHDVTMREDEPRKWRCELTVRSKSEERLNNPYRFLITYVGFFNVVEAFPSERVEVMVRTNAPALLYSAAREALLPLTGRGRYPAIILPSVTFVQPPTVETQKKTDQEGAAVGAPAVHVSSKKVAKKATKKGRKG